MKYNLSPANCLPRTWRPSLMFYLILIFLFVSPLFTGLLELNFKTALASSDYSPGNSSHFSLNSPCDNPLLVNLISDDAATCHTLRNALNSLTGNPANQPVTVTVDLLPGAIIKVTSGGMIVPPGVIVHGVCNSSPDSGRITINGNGMPGPGLILEGSDTLYGFNIGGFNGVQIKTTGTKPNNKLNCLTASRNLPPHYGPPASIGPTDGTPQTINTGASAAVAFKALVKDSSANPLAGIPVLFQAPAAGPSGTFSTGGISTTVNTDNDGIATAPAFTANLVEGSYTVSASVPQVATPASFSITNSSGSVPDPAQVAPPINRTIATNVANSSAFLYTGPKPVQTGVTSGTISATLVSVLKGNVLTRDGQPLSGAAVTILNHPEFGQTLSRQDGKFDLAVNGGQVLTVNFTKAGFLQAQRQVNPDWQSYASVPDAALIPLDSAVTTISTSSSEPIQVARANPVTDNDGTRQSTLFFSQGTTATMSLADGSTQPLGDFHIRATEYTVGTNGPKAMPADLPPNSFYTYAVEYSVDEAQAAGATGVTFSQPVVTYLENFLNFPVGTTVPSGYYDRAQARWIPSNNGLVIKILSVTNGLADLALDNSNTPADATALAQAGITEAERSRLATLYPVNQTLWRVSVNHFSPQDYNLGWSPPADARPPLLDPDKLNTDNPADTHCQSGSIIYCESQALGENLSLNGTPYQLHYQSTRTQDYKAAYSLTIPLTQGSFPASLQGIGLQVEVMGEKFDYSFAPGTASYIFTWDGKDAYGRLVQGRQSAKITVSYLYIPVYRQSIGFAYWPSGPVLNQARTKAIISQTFVKSLGAWDNSSAGLGGWSLDLVHSYDPIAKQLYLGDGTMRGDKAADTTVITTVGGSPDSAAAGPDSTNTGDGIPATSAYMHPLGVVVGPDGSVYESDESRIRRIRPDGIIETVAGTLSGGSEQDGVPALSANLGNITSLDRASDGTFYFAAVNSAGVWRVRKVTPGGLVQTVAGDTSTVANYNGDGIPATQAVLDNVQGIAITPDGTLYINDSSHFRIRRVGTDGIISTVAGTGAAGHSGDGGPADAAQIGGPNGITITRDGTIYFTEGGVYIRKIGPGNIITTIAGNGTCNRFTDQVSGDGLPASNVSICPGLGIAIGPDGGLYYSEQYAIRRIGPEGILTTVAGGHAKTTFDSSGNYRQSEGQLAVTAYIYRGQGIAFAPDQSLYIAQYQTYAIRKIQVASSQLLVGQLLYPSFDGSEVYLFSSSGQHLRTLDALTGAVRYQFGYNSRGQLISIADSSGNTTTVERDGTGNPVALVAPGGQHTSLSLDANGYLATLTGPDNLPVSLTYTGGGLLTSLKDRRNNTFSFTYDSQGRLTKDQDPAGGFKALSRFEYSGGYSVTVTTAEGRSSVFGVQKLADKSSRLTSVSPTGETNILQVNPDGTQTVSYADGSVLRFTNGSDPRWGMLAPALVSATLTLSGSVTETVTASRDVVLSNPADPFSLAFLSSSENINGRSYTSDYDASSRTFTNHSPASHENSTVVLDNKGRTLSIAYPGKATINYQYDPNNGRLLSRTQGGESLTYTYDTFNRLTGVANAQGETTTYGYDPSGRVISTTTPAGKTYQFGYDGNNNRTSIQMPSGEIHALSYNQVNLESAYTPPGNPAFTKNYDPDQSLISRLLPDGRNITQVYDNGGRVSGLNSSEDNIVVGYDPADLTGRATSLTLTPAGGGTSEGLGFSYQSDLLKSQSFSGTASGNFSYGYDSNNFQTSQSLSSGTVTINTAFTRDGDGYLTSYGPFTYTRNGPSRATSQISGGGLALNFTYDNLLHLTGKSQAVGSVPASYNLQLTYNSVGRIIQRVETLAGTARTYNYTYDANSQLLAVTRDGAAYESYNYDANGNRTSRTLTGTPAQTANYDAQDRLVSLAGTTYTFNSNGFLATRNSDTFQYNAHGNLLQAVVSGQTVSYRYDGLNRRVARIDGSGTYQYLYGNAGDPFQVSAIRNPGGQLSYFYYNESGRLFAFEQDGVRYFVATDQVGTPRVIQDGTGNIVKTLEYDSFGVQLSDSNPAFDLPVGFAGGLTDPLTGLVHFGMRDYEPASGRWTTRDPVLFSGRQANLYQYVGNNPVSLNDPSGLFSIGGSFYAGPGGGGKISITSEGVSICVEIGLGLGESVSVDPLAGLDDTSSSIDAEISAGTGTLGVTVGGQIDDCGKFTNNSNACLGPVCTNLGSVGVQGDRGSFNSKLKDTFKTKPFKESLQGKVAAIFCKKF